MPLQICHTKCNTGKTCVSCLARIYCTCYSVVCRQTYHTEDACIDSSDHCIGNTRNYILHARSDCHYLRTLLYYNTDLWFTALCEESVSARQSQTLTPIENFSIFVSKQRRGEIGKGEIERKINLPGIILLQ